MEASGSNPPSAAPSHSSLLPALSPTHSHLEHPASLHTLSTSHTGHHAGAMHPGPSPSPHPRPPHAMTPHEYNPSHPQQMSHPPPHVVHPQHGMHGSNGMTPGLSHSQGSTQMHASLQTPGAGGHHGLHMVQLTPGQGNAFAGVMGTGHATPGGGAKVYASVYSGIPVFEAMIRGISVMRRSSDSWVNATQILKVAGVPKSARTKILEKEILSGTHEKVQGGYGKYQGTWIPFQRGQELAAQYGVTQYLAPIFDFIPSPANVAALPLARHETPDRSGANKTPGSAMMPYSNLSGQTPQMRTTQGAGRTYSPMHPSELPPPPPPQFAVSNGDPFIVQHTLQSQIPNPYMYQNMLPLESAYRPETLAPPVDINGFGLAPSHSDVYVDQYGQPHPVHYANGEAEPPAKRTKTEPDAMEVDAEAEADEDSDDEFKDAPPLPSSMRLSNKPLRPKASTASAKARGKFMALFQEDASDVREFLGLPEANSEEVPEFDIDMIIDDQGHTALHWASSLAKINLVTQLIALGSDMHRGNYAGETPLMRSVLATNHSEANTFTELLQILSPSIRTIDHAHRTVLHHIALIAGVKGRAGSARGYMTGVLEWVAKEQQSGETSGSLSSLNGGITPTLSLKTLVDVQDVHGDTALNVAARVGNKGLVNLLIEAGADKARANKLGLKPADFGVETEILKITPGETVVSNLKSEIPKPERQSRDVQKNISAIFESVNETFTGEMLAKQTKLNAIEQSVRHATKSLSEKRQQVQRLQSTLGEMEQVQQRAENVRRAVTRTNASEWSGRTALSQETGSSAVPIPPSFRPDPTTTAAPAPNGEDIPLPDRGDVNGVIKLRRMAAWENRIAEVLEDRIAALQGDNMDKGIKYRRLVSLCTKVPVDKVDSMLDGLVAAVESDGTAIDMSRVSAFMTRMKQTDP